MLRRIMIYLIVTCFLVVIGLGVWYFNRPRPAPMQATSLFKGVTYRREILNQPRPIIVHVVTIDLNTPGIGFLVTPKDDVEGFDYRARTTSQFLEEFDLQLAINGDFFDPWRDFGPWDYYPHEGDGVNARGLTISQGQPITAGYAPASDYATLFVTPQNQITFEPPEAVEHALSGLMLLRDGEYVAEWGDDAYLRQPHPRTAVAVDQSRQQLILVVIDGRQPNYSEGVTLPELADILREAGAYHALNLDGGGSSTLVMQGEDGPVQLGSAVHTRIPGRERPIANHFGIYAG